MATDDERREETEPVVRCRDCRWGRAVEAVGCIRMLDMATGDGQDPSTCAGPQDPDGFCAWGERREEAGHGEHDGRP